jgi:hypothetical protein
MTGTTSRNGQRGGWRARAGRWFAALLSLLALGALAPARAEPKPLSKEEQAKIDRTIDKGIAFLKHAQSKKGCWDQGHFEAKYPMGATSMVALALLEAGVPADDPAIQKAADWLRPRLARLDLTYELSLAVLFFDKLGDPQDKGAIRSLALRLIAGQCRTGGWGYRCPTLSPKNEEAFPDLLRRLEGAADGKALPKVPEPFNVLTVFQDPAKLPWREGDPPEPPGRHHGDGGKKDKRLFQGSTDNSNTQFALLALWAARRHDVPVATTLRLAARRFENTQNADGTWPYLYRGRGINEQELGVRCMTTVGLLGLALREGLRAEKDVPAAADAQMLRGLAAVSLYIGEPTGQMRIPLAMKDHYFLWSLANLARLYDLPTIGGKDWYRWGAEILVTNQAPGGHWEDSWGESDGAGGFRTDPYLVYRKYGLSLNTTFALLFLKRSHLLPDLTAKLPCKPEVLEKGIAAALQGRPLPAELAQPEPTPKKP